jgi:hypothetical protein
MHATAAYFCVLARALRASCAALYDDNLLLCNSALLDNKLHGIHVSASVKHDMTRYHCPY